MRVSVLLKSITHPYSGKTISKTYNKEIIDKIMENYFPKLIVNKPFIIISKLNGNKEELELKYLENYDKSK